MQKPLKPTKAGVSDLKIFNRNILDQKPSQVNTEISKFLLINSPQSESRGRFCHLQKLIKQRKLTESLEILESAGFSEDLALFFIANIQYSLEVV